LEDIPKVLKAVGFSLERIVKANVDLANMSNFAAMNEIYVQVWMVSPSQFTNRAMLTIGADYNSSTGMQCLRR
jgi:enamine deaminase RidA (YjgF/YER057c/UK114 family)